MQSFTCDFESSLTIGQLQCKQPSKQLSYWCHWHEGQTCQFRDLTTTHALEMSRSKWHATNPKPITSKCI